MCVRLCVFVCSGVERDIEYSTYTMGHFSDIVLVVLNKLIACVGLLIFVHN